MSTHANMVKMTVTSVASAGVGTITLNAASSGYQSFGTAYGADATVDILITEGATWEVARNCTYTHSGTTVTRGTLEASSTGSAVAFTSAAVVSVIASAELGNKLEMALKAVTPGGRLTLESGVPVSTTDQTAKTSIYYTPFVHNIINLWDGAAWKPISFTEYTLALGTLTSGKPYDVFAYLNSGALALEVLVWTNDTTRATAVTLQDGRYCKSGDKTRLLLGTFYTTATTTTEDSLEYRYLWNAYNRVGRRQFKDAGSSGHNYNTLTLRAYNNGTGDLSLKCLRGLDNDPANYSLAILLNPGNAGNGGRVAISIDATSTYSDSYTAADVTVLTVAFRLGGAPLIRNIGVGRHTAYMVETATMYTAGNVNFDYGRLVGEVMA